MAVAARPLGRQAGWQVNSDWEGSYPGTYLRRVERMRAMMQATKPIDELKAGDIVLLDDGRRAVVEYNTPYVTHIRPSVTMVMNRVVAVTDDGSTEYVDGAWRDLVPVIVD